MCLECQNLLLIKQEQILRTPSYNKTGADYGKDSKLLLDIYCSKNYFFSSVFFFFFFVVSCTKIRQEHIVEVILKEMYIIVIITSTETFLEDT